MKYRTIAQSAFTSSVSISLLQRTMEAATHSTSSISATIETTPVISNSRNVKKSSERLLIPPLSLSDNEQQESSETKKKTVVAQFSPSNGYHDVEWSFKDLAMSDSSTEGRKSSIKAEPTFWSKPLSFLETLSRKRADSKSLWLTRPSSESSAPDGIVRGIPNYGQTCFCNSVLQSLASLDAMVAYLECIKATQPFRLREVDDSQSFTTNELLADLILRVNGDVVNDKKLDTRGLLQQVGKTHKQFAAAAGRLVGREQQDAQEFLHALVDTVVLPQNLPSPTCMAPVLPLSVVTTSGNNVWDAGEEEDEDDTGDDHELLIAGMGRSYKEDTSLFRGNIAGVDYAPEPSQIRRFQEEKKDDAKHEKMQVVPPPALALRVPGSSQNSIRIMETTTNSSTPNPLTGWLASTLQCRVCHHVRPLRNTPFGDLALLPTSVTNSARRSQRNAGEPPSKAHTGSIPPPCRLEECLEEFTSIERVSDVECHHCSLVALQQKLEEDIELYSGAVECSRSKSETDDASSHLLDELEMAQYRLARIHQISPDNDEEIEKLLQEHSAATGEEHWTRVARVDAFKCLLLSRLPSILCLHVQRRHYDPIANRMTKTMQHVVFPEFLNVGPYCAYAGGYQASSGWTGTTPQHLLRLPQPSPVTYRLKSVIEHCGSAFGGHYQCYRRDSNGDWLFCSDDVVKKVDWRRVQNSQAYMLFYEAV